MNSYNRNENAIGIVFAIVLIVIMGVIVYSAYTSTNRLESNALPPEESSGNNNIAIYDNSTTNSPSSVNIYVPDHSLYPNAPSTPVPILTQIAYYSTNIYDQDLNRVQNIKLAIAKISGTVIKKGETFSFNSTVGPMGEAQGYKEATGFDNNGNKVKMIGGGMCQISSTLYNAALIANLEIVERHPHSRRVYYVPQDKDATVYYNTLDLKFKNTTNDDIQIVATSSKSNVTIILDKITYGF